MKNSGIRDSLSVYWSVYLSIAITLGIFAGIFFLFENRSHYVDEISSWPSAKATILSSKFDTAIVENQTGPGSQISADLILHCETPNKSWEVHYFHIWPNSSMSTYRQILAKGKVINVRYSPSNPDSISFYPLLPD